MDVVTTEVKTYLNGGLVESVTASSCGHTCIIKIVKPWWFPVTMKACLLIRSIGIPIPRFVAQYLYDSLRYESSCS